MVTEVAARKALPDVSKVAFGHEFSDHMLKIEWCAEEGWKAPEITPHGPLMLDPAVSSLHYALQGFEGMKAYKDHDGNVRMFRPDMNMKRLNTTAAKMSLPSVNGDQFVACIKELLKLDSRWVPAEKGYSLYLRPTIISTEPTLGVSVPTKALLYVITSPVGPYFKSGFKAVDLLADSTYVRAWPGGTGDVKCGGNYGCTIEPAKGAAEKGCAQLIWLFGPDENVTEVGAMNLFFMWKSKDGSTTELVTAPLDGTILPGVTRDSVIQLAKEDPNITVREEAYTIHDVVEAIRDGRMVEAFGAGTAALICPVKGIKYKDNYYAIPLDPADSTSEAGAFSQAMQSKITSIQYGETDHPWSIVV